MIVDVDAYLVNLALLVVLIGAGIYSQTRQKDAPAFAPLPAEDDDTELETGEDKGDDKEGYNGPGSNADLRFRAFRNRFLRVYVLAVAADWLQVCKDPFSPPSCNSAIGLELWGSEQD